MHRFFTDNIHDGIAVIAGEDVRHIARVLRLRIGDTVEISDGACTDYTGRIVELGQDAVRCDLTDARRAPTESPCRVTLFQALPKTGKMETIVQKCVELGAEAVVPVVTARCVAVPTRDFENKLVRYRRVALEAAKQSRRGIVPRVLPVVTIEKADFAGFDAVLVAYEDERTVTLKRALAGIAPTARIAVCIGPEGGWERGEIEALAARGAASVSLGARILRTETAGPAMLAQVLFALEP